MSKAIKNPFEYEAASNLSPDMVADYFIDDFNYSRFIQSRRNVFLVGERGSGKTMALLFNSSRIQRLIATKQGREPALENIGVYVPCNTPLTYKPEFELLEPFLSSVLSEHLFALSISHAIVTTLADIPDLLAGLNEPTIRSELSAMLAAELLEDQDLFDSIRIFLEGQIRETQRTAISHDLSAYHKETFSFASLVMPLLALCRRSVPRLANTHFSLLIDDAQSLNDIQLKALNSWIAFRDHSLFSFKVATTKVSRGTRRTTSGGSILEIHDYTTIDLERPLHNPNTGFYQLADKIVARRLKEVGISASPSEFFPINKRMEDDLKRAEEKTRDLAKEKYGNSATTKQISDFVYKRARARYFQERSSSANRPPYSGFETIVYISTGVIRNLLEPCYWMFDRAISAQDDREYEKIDFVPPSIQTEIILERSDAAWDRLRDRLANDIEGCSIENGLRANRLVTALASLFRDRLLGDGSEPSAISFTVSRRGSPSMEDLQLILDILRSAQMLYVRTGTAKDEGGREPYYVPNRILWPSRGLDPHGQYARVSLTSDALWQAAETGRLDLPAEPGQLFQTGTGQQELWNDDN